MADDAGDEVRIDLLQLLEENEHEVLALIRSSSAAARLRFHLDAQPQQQLPTTPAALKAVLQEQNQWLKAVLERTLHVEPAGVGVCQWKRWLTGQRLKGVADRGFLSRRFRFRPLEAACARGVLEL